MTMLCDPQAQTAAARFAEYYQRCGYSCTLRDGRLWLEENRVVFPIAPACQSSVLAADEARELLTHFRRAIVVRTDDGVRPELTAGDWYAILGTRHVPLEECPTKIRSEIRSGLQQNIVRPIGVKCFAEHGCALYAAAQARYRKSAASEEQFRERALAAQDFSDIIELWGVFNHKQLVGCAQCHRYGNTEISYSSVAFDPEFFKFHTSSALFYRLSEHYLGEHCVRYVNAGYRTLWHPTSLQPMLIRKFAFAPTYARLHLHYRPSVARIMALPAGLRRLLGRASSRFAALNALHEAQSPHDL